MQRVDIAVVGAGLTGSAAARHAAELGAEVVLVGVEEPADRARAEVFASHYDAGRITRVLDPEPGRAALALASLRRHRELEAATGVSFFHETGHLAVGPAETLQAGYLASLRASADRLGVGLESLDEQALRQRFPMFRFEPGSHGLYQPALAGFIDPRALVRAQLSLLNTLGGRLCRDRVESVSAGPGGLQVQAAGGGRWLAGRVILAAGVFQQAVQCPGAPMHIGVETLSAVLARVSSAEVARLGPLPSLIYKPRDADQNVYLLPPTRYPDGHCYLKLGSPWPHAVLQDPDALADWFRTPLPQSLADGLAGRLQEFMPGLRAEGLHFDTCAAQHTPGGYGRLGPSQDPRLIWCLGCGAGAKSSDEFGRLAAVLAHQGSWDSPLPAALFDPRQGKAFEHPAPAGSPYNAHAA